METDFVVTVPVDNVEDREALGNLMARVPAVLDQFPPESTAGPQPGRVEIIAVANGQEMRCTFTTERAEAARARGLHGAAL
jgi:hypothetical protein